MSGDDLGCILTAAALGLGGFWVWNNYELVERKPAQPITYASMKPSRPTGTLPIGTDSSDGVWSLDADSVRGDSAHRQGWVRINGKKPIGRISYSQSLYLVDCSTGAQKALATTYYDAKGGVVMQKDTTPEKAAVSYSPPDTLGAIIVSRLCLPGFDAPK